MKYVPIVIQPEKPRGVKRRRGDPGEDSPYHYEGSSKKKGLSEDDREKILQMVNEEPEVS